MKRAFLLLALAFSVMLSATPVLAQDGFYVVGGRYTPGTKINGLPYTISAPGYYYLTGNLTYTRGHGITVNADNVTLDLMGFVLSGPGTDSYTGIIIGGSNVEVRNGTLNGWQQGIIQESGIGSRAIGVRAVGNSIGISLHYNSLIQGCSASEGSSPGHFGLGVITGTISGCTVYNFTSYSPSTGSLIVDFGGAASDNVVINCNNIGIKAQEPAAISHNVVLNCTTGISNEGGGSIVGNAVLANAGQTGIAPATGVYPLPPNPATPSLLDQNSVNGNGTHYGPGNNATVKGLNGG